ncbi:P-loop containing nucleoside triphosphate hydrolase protein [Ganoderma leucocontextum]|nr:P-loop containing nucleoside triphosphate hydrolase protein [Ganoderma leucocontextum]
MTVAGTGAGKSMVFALLAIAAELSGADGLVIVVCPLKALQLDQIRRFNNFGKDPVVVEGEGALESPNRFASLRIRAVAVNEDNNDKSVFTSLAKGKTRLCYAAPECLLRNEHFKQLFRDESFRSKLVALLVDEAHVIAQWAKDFRRDYGELSQLRVVTGTEIPCGLLSATFPSEVFNLCLASCRMGENRRFWGIDLGTDRPNLALWVRPLEYSARSFAALFPFIPENPTTREDLPKSIFYFRTRRAARTACGLLQRLVPATLREMLWPYTAVSSEHYKATIMERFRMGEARWLFCTDAAGMGCDIPDIKDSVIYGVQDLCSAFQKGGRAARDPSVSGRMVWLVEDWAFEDYAAGKKEVERRAKLDPASLTYINRSGSDHCMREFAVKYFHPRPGFIEESRNIKYEQGDEIVVEENRQHSAMWVVRKAGGKVPAEKCCSARSCQPGDAATAVGQLTDHDRQRIASMLKSLQAGSLPPPSSPAASRPSSPVEDNSATLSPSRQCSKAERAVLDDILHDWRSTRWRAMAPSNKFLSYHWVMDDDNIGKLVHKAHLLVNAPELNAELIRTLICWITTPETMASLVAVLHDFRTAFKGRTEGRRKKANTRRVTQARDGSPTLQSRTVKGVPSGFIHTCVYYCH